ncbi:TATA-box binding protein-like protein [Piedraia hortae CBS 480.64]|uniref:TATA-box binding protein-like protein n=1 Tax=Piedraia hortae CBS 480.64 TaxID=1314780 RepID=A0A6A7C245_9PEZI|nr:TATA-box binding protein-like protein [Piedraia hortae CBS 480.64]
MSNRADLTAALCGSHEDVAKAVGKKYLFKLAAEASVSRVPGEPVPPVLHNVVGTVDLDIIIKLQTVGEKAINVEYNPKRFTAARIRLREPKSCTSVFTNGMLVVAGATSRANCRLAARKIARMMQKIGFKPYFLDFKITNMVANAHLGYRVHLTALKASLEEHVSSCFFEPELCSGLTYRLAKLSVIVYATGSVLFSGASSEDDIMEAYNHITGVARSFRLKDGTNIPQH